MSYAPPLPLPVPASMPAVHPSVVSLDLAGLGLLSAEEASSNQQLEFTVRQLLNLHAGGVLPRGAGHNSPARPAPAEYQPF
jgi:hypothetical protein